MNGQLAPTSCKFAAPCAGALSPRWDPCGRQSRGWQDAPVRQPQVANALTWNANRPYTIMLPPIPSRCSGAGCLMQAYDEYCLPIVSGMSCPGGQRRWCAMSTALPCRPDPVMTPAACPPMRARAQRAQRCPCACPGWTDARAPCPAGRGEARSAPQGSALPLPLANASHGDRLPGRRGPPISRPALPAAAMTDPPAGMPIHRARSTRCPMTAHEMKP